MPASNRALLLAVPFALLVGHGRAAANSCETDQLLPAHEQVPAGCPVALYARIGSNLVPGAITADRGGTSVQVGVAGATSQPGYSTVARTWFDRYACAWQDSQETFSFDVYTATVTTQQGDRLTWDDSGRSIEVIAAGTCPGVAMSWMPACADPLPPPECLPPPDGDAGCDGGFGEYGSDAGVDTIIPISGGGGESGGCSTAPGGAGSAATAIGVLAGLLALGRRGRRE